jgi:hypothetical protein
LPKNKQVSETKELREQYFEEAKDLRVLRTVESEVWYYRGSLENPRWKDEDPSSVLLVFCWVTLTYSVFVIFRR